MQPYLDHNKPITDQYTQNCLESPPASFSVFIDPTPQPGSSESLMVTSIEKRDLAVHKKTGQKDKCEYCDKKFSRLSRLTRHMRIHTGETPYQCGCCGQTFKESHHLKIHLRIHTGEKPYECQYCGTRFSRSHHLKTHLGTHTGETIYVCQHCNKSFFCSQHLKTHQWLDSC